MTEYTLFISNLTNKTQITERAKDVFLSFSDCHASADVIFMNDIHNELCVCLKTTTCVYLNRGGRTLQLVQNKPYRVLPDDVLSSDNARYLITRILQSAPLKRRATALFAAGLMPLLAACSPNASSPAPTDQPAEVPTQIIETNHEVGKMVVSDSDEPQNDNAQTAENTVNAPGAPQNDNAQNTDNAGNDNAQPPATPTDVERPDVPRVVKGEPTRPTEIKRPDVDKEVMGKRRPEPPKPKPDSDAK